MTPHHLQIPDFPLLSVHLAQTRNACERNARNASHLQEMQENPLDSTLNASRELPAVFLAPCLHPACSVKDKELNKRTRTCIKCIITASSPPNSSSLLLNLSLDLPFWGNPESMQSTAQAESRGKLPSGSSNQAVSCRTASPVPGWALCPQLDIF